MSGIRVSSASVENSTGVRLELGSGAAMNLGTASNLSLPTLALYDDFTDTWSHNIGRYPRENAEGPVWEEPRSEDKGPLMASLFHTGIIGRSPLRIEWRIYLGKRWVECLMRINWVERNRILKFEWRLPGRIGRREDGIMNGSLFRKNDGLERPFRDWVRLPLQREEGEDSVLAVIAPEVFAMDCDESCLSLTLLRSCSMAWHEPHSDSNPRSITSDRGEHFLRLRFLSAENLSAADLDQIAFAWQRPILTAELTRGMRNRNLRRKYTPGRLAS